MSTLDRRRFLQHALAWPVGLQALHWAGPSEAAVGSDYRALVCIYLLGGNDACNTVLPTDSASWTHYQNHRNPSSRIQGSGSGIAILPPGTAQQAQSDDPLARLGGALPIATGEAHTGRSLALHPSLKATASLYASGRMAIVANVGTLLGPTTKDDWLDAARRKPPKLFSHIDQACTWQTLGIQGNAKGWGGLMADALLPQLDDPQAAETWRTLACMSPTTEAMWLNGHRIQPYYSSSGAVLTLGSQGRLMDQTGLHQAVRQIMQGDAAETQLLKQAYQETARLGLRASDRLAPVLPAQYQGPWGTPGAPSHWQDPMLQFSSDAGGGGMNDLALQLQMVARLIEANRAGGFGVNRQMFFVTLGGFDTHDRQTVQHAMRLAQLDHAFAYFDRVLSTMPGGDLRDQVTTFTASDFGRSFTSNGDGTDHGWGGHHFVMGGAVRGGEVYGRIPVYATADAGGEFDSPDQIHNGILLPSTSVEQYAATLGAWMGVGADSLATVLPQLQQHPSGQRQLGFMG
jgi:uncharacterized protein (DUF1501 family)